MSQGQNEEITVSGTVGESLHVSQAKYSPRKGQTNVHRPLFLLLHGWGSNEDDIAQLMPYIAPRHDYVSLRGPLEVPGSEMNMFGRGYSWFHRAVPKGKNLDLDGFAAASAIDEWVTNNLPADREIVLMGFSQGGMLAVHLLRINPERYRAAISLSGFLAPAYLEETAPADQRLAPLSIPVFFGFGSDDEVVTVNQSQELEGWLDKHTCLRSRSYKNVGHSVAPSEIDDLRQWLVEIGVSSGLM